MTPPSCPWLHSWSRASLHPHGRFLGKGVARITQGEAVAKAAGLTCIAVPLFVETDVSAADRVVQSLEELLAT